MAMRLLQAAITPDTAEGSSTMNSFIFHSPDATRLPLKVFNNESNVILLCKESQPIANQNQTTKNVNQENKICNQQSLFLSMWHLTEASDIQQN